jgi:hypothetical protein
MPAVSVPLPDGEWTVTLDDGAQRGGSMDELRALYQAGHIHEDSFVWRDGMADWQMLNETPELLQALRSRPSMGPSRPPRPTASGSPAVGQPNLGGALFGGGGQAARVAPRSGEQDLFGAPKQPPPVEEEVATSAPANPAAKPVIPKFTAERGENSVLFTIDTILAVGNQGGRKAPSAFPDEEKVDFSKLASVAPPPRDDGSYEQSFDAPPSFGGLSAGALAAPMLPTTIEPEPIPEPEPMPYNPYETPQKSNKGLIVGLGAAVALLLVVSLGFGGYVLFGKEEPVAANTAAASATAEKKGWDTTDEDKKDEDKKDDDKKDEDKKDDDKKDEDKKADDKKDTADPKATATAKVGGPLPPSTTTGKALVDPKKDDTKKEDAKTDVKPDVPAASADRKFSRSAAVSALNSAAGAASGCKKADGPTGRGRVSVTFAPSGRVTTAVVNGPPFAGTSVGGCVAAAFRRASVPPFDGSPVTVHKSFTIN